MKEQIYTLTCYDCSTDFKEGNLLELKSYIKGEYMDWSDVEYNCDNQYEFMCADCARLNS